jgi:hypothetical protein
MISYDEGQFKNVPYEFLLRAPHVNANSGQVCSVALS